VLSGHNGWVLCVEWEAMERKLATGGHDGHVSHQHYSCLTILIDRTPTPQLLRPGPCCSSAPQLRLWDPKTGKPIGDPLKGHSKWVTSLAWEPIHLCVWTSFLVALCFRSPSAFAFNAIIHSFVPGFNALSPVSLGTLLLLVLRPLPRMAVSGFGQARREDWNMRSEDILPA
jgi:WD40 repeat protein